MAIITIPKILQEKLTEAGADALVGILDKVEERSEAHTLQVAEERFEKKLEQAKSELRDDINKVDKHLEQVKSALKEEIGAVRSELKEEIVGVRSELKKETADLKTELKTGIASIRAESKTDIANLRTELKSDIANVRADLIKWMFIFWAGQVITITGILIAFLKK